MIGRTLSHYRILEEIGRDGMGDVYRAKDTRLDRTVAIKVLAAHLEKSSHLDERFEREAKVISGLNHPNICILFDVGHENGTRFMVMEYLEGETLAERLRRGALSEKQVLSHAVQITDARPGARDGASPYR